MRCVMLLVLITYCLVVVGGTLRPNIIFIVVDDMGFNDAPWKDNGLHTPYLKKLAQRGTILDQYYVPATCSPSRAAILTGYYPHHVGLQSAINPLSPIGLPLSFKLLPEELKTLGYSTHAIGKWHLGFCNVDYLPTRRGFDSFVGKYLGSGDHFNHTRRYQDRQGRVKSGYDLWKNEKVLRLNKTVYSTDLFVKEAVNIIEKQPWETPFYVYLSFPAPHAPLQAPKKYMKNCTSPNKERRLFCGMVSAIDRGVRNIMKAVKRTHRKNNTLVIFTTDNGGYKQFGSDNFPLRGSKNTFWEGGTRGIGFIHGLNVIRHSVYKKLMHAVDWYPTILRATGHKLSHYTPMDGINQWDGLIGRKGLERHEVINGLKITKYKAELAIRENEFKLVWLTHHTDKLFGKPALEYEGASDDQFCLFNITVDPEERHDLTLVNPFMVTKLKAKLLNYLSTAVKPINRPPTPQGYPSRFGGLFSPGWCQSKKLTHFLSNVEQLNDL